MNPSKNYYHILGITSSASRDEVRKAFRRLAMKYHPDKRQPDSATVSTDAFLDIQEAYQVLMNPKKKAEYDFASYLQNPMRKREVKISSVEDVLQLSKKIRASVSKSDPFRTDLDILFFEISSLLSDANIEILQSDTNEKTNHSIVQNILSAAEQLPLFMAEQIINRLETFTKDQPQSQKAIGLFYRECKQKHYWNRYKVLIAATIAILFCLLIYLSGAK